MYKRYERYKDSGVDWIGEVPEHWSVNKLGYLLERNDGGVWGDDPSENGVIVLRSTEITLDGCWNINEPAKRSLSKKEYNSALLEKGDLLLTKSSGSEQHIGKTAIVDNNVAELRCAFSNFMQRLRTKENLVPKYLHYFLNNNGREQLLHLSTTTTGLKNLSGSIINNLKLQAPTINEQTFISTFLNKKTSAIDSLIADKEELIKKLEEYKQSIITEAVTKGLNPDVKMKGSGIEWIGEIPEHWDLTKVKYLLKRNKNAIKVGPFGSQLTADEMAHNQVKVYNQRNVYDKDCTKGENYISKGKYETLKSFTVYPEDILVTTRGTIGQAYVLPEDCEIGILHPCLMRIQVKNDLIYFRFIEEIFNETNIVANQIFYESNSTTIEVIYSETLKNLYLPLPGLEEQGMILKEIDRIKKLYESLISDVQTQIQNLKSYRQSLIYEAVTGKIDVRDYQSERSEKLA